MIADVMSRFASQSTEGLLVWMAEALERNA